MNLKTTVTLAVSATPDYTAGDNVGGKLTITVKEGEPLLLQDVTVIDLDDQKAALEILFFDENPSAGTYTDNGAFTLHATDTPKVIGRVAVATADYVTTGTRATASLKNVGLVLTDQSRNSAIYALIVTSGTPNYSSTASLTLKLGFIAR